MTLNNTIRQKPAAASPVAVRADQLTASSAALFDFDIGGVFRSDQTLIERRNLAVSKTAKLLLIHKSSIAMGEMTERQQAPVPFSIAVPSS